MSHECRISTIFSMYALSIGLYGFPLIYVYRNTCYRVVREYLFIIDVNWFQSKNYWATHFSFFRVRYRYQYRYRFHPKRVEKIRDPKPSDDDKVWLTLTHNLQYTITCARLMACYNNRNVCRSKFIQYLWENTPFAVRHTLCVFNLFTYGQINQMNGGC